MASESHKRKRQSPASDTIQHLVALLHHDSANDLTAALSSLPAGSSIRLRINAEISINPAVLPAPRGRDILPQPVLLGTVDLDESDINEYLKGNSTRPTRPPSLGDETSRDNSDAREEPVSLCPDVPQVAISFASATPPCEEENHIVGSSRPPPPGPSPEKSPKTDGKPRVTNITDTEATNDLPMPPLVASPTTRQLQTKSREFPQRAMKSGKGPNQMQPSSIDKFIAGVWKQIYSNVELAPMSLDEDCIPMSTGISANQDVFREINSLCLRMTTISRCSRSLETIVQAYWVDCFDFRVKEIGIEKPSLSNIEAKMFVLREACSILKWSEKELRNRLAVWRGYKEIKDAGGWVCLAFAGSGKFQSCFEVAADTIHPRWRKLLNIIGVDSPPMYTGHPHDWVVCNTATPVTLRSTYMQWDPGFQFAHLEDSMLDEATWGTEDPRISTTRFTAFCNECGYFQSNNFSVNECRCYPELYGNCKVPPAVQVFRTLRAKNNGLIARCDFARGSAIGEFVGLITKGIQGKDVMQGGAPLNRYQIFQGRMGNYTRFVNHSCAPNSRFQKFCWLGSERVILVSSGVEAGHEITVDYSDEYWKGLDKECLCGQSCCRYLRKQV